MSKCIIGESCSEHGYIHGAEAEELRERFEDLIARRRSIVSSEIQRILDEVDARDSLAFVLVRGARKVLSGAEVRRRKARR